jgi:hypothetical protein
MHPASYVFGTSGLFNQTGGWNTGIAFLFGLLSVQWTVRAAAAFIPTNQTDSPLDDGQLLVLLNSSLMLTSH